MEILSYRYIGSDGMLSSDFLMEVSGYISCPDLSLYSSAFIDSRVSPHPLRLYVPELQRLSTYIASDTSLIVGAEIRMGSDTGLMLKCFLAESQIQARYQYYVGSRDGAYPYEDYRRWSYHINYFMPDGVIAGGWVAQIQDHFRDIHARRICRTLFSLYDTARIVM
jgi:hypothetical protein